VNSTRLFVLGALFRDGAMHGHQIRRAAQMDHSDLWTDVKPGSLYGVLHRMEAEGLVRAVSTEQQGRFPARTVYEITAEGRRELQVQRDEALRGTRLKPDPFDLALLNTEDLAEEELRGMLVDRHEAFVAQLAALRRLRETADPYLSDLERVTFEHSLRRVRTEVEWHELLLQELPKLVSDGRKDGA
jgi:DNA-binding PadR family transcriptional regulator